MADLRRFLLDFFSDGIVCGAADVKEFTAFTAVYPGVMARWNAKSISGLYGKFFATIEPNRHCAFGAVACMRGLTAGSSRDRLHIV